MFKIGQRVVCVNGIYNLKKNDIYIVIEISEDTHGVLVKEVQPRYGIMYWDWRFRPLNYDIISNKEVISEIIEEKSDLPVKEEKEIKV